MILAQRQFRDAQRLRSTMNGIESGEWSSQCIAKNVSNEDVSTVLSPRSLIFYIKSRIVSSSLLCLLIWNCQCCYVYMIHDTDKSKKLDDWMLSFQLVIHNLHCITRDSIRNPFLADIAPLFHTFVQFNWKAKSPAVDEFDQSVSASAFIHRPHAVAIQPCAKLEAKKSYKMNLLIWHLMFAKILSVAVCECASVCVECGTVWTAVYGHQG